MTIERHHWQAYITVYKSKIKLCRLLIFDKKTYERLLCVFPISYTLQLLILTRLCTWYQLAISKVYLVSKPRINSHQSKYSLNTIYDHQEGTCSVKVRKRSILIQRIFDEYINICIYIYIYLYICIYIYI